MGQLAGGEARDAIGWGLAGRQKGPEQRDGWRSTCQWGRGRRVGVGPHNGSDFRNLPSPPPPDACKQLTAMESG